MNLDIIQYAREVGLLQRTPQYRNTNSDRMKSSVQQSEFTRVLIRHMTWQRPRYRYYPLYNNIFNRTLICYISFYIQSMKYFLQMSILVLLFWILFSPTWQQIRNSSVLFELSSTHRRHKEITT
jgi:hypothetical protein